tara:strand:+ start:82 stop:435 length:354 start_codon:yes stop_codon:yes gene_type:complete
MQKKSKSRSKSRSKSPKRTSPLNIFNVARQLSEKQKQVALNAPPFVPMQPAPRVSPFGRTNVPTFGMNILDVARQHSEEKKHNMLTAKHFKPKGKGKKSRSVKKRKHVKKRKSVKKR